MTLVGTLLKPFTTLSLLSVPILFVFRMKSQKARYYINLSIYTLCLLTTSAVAIGISLTLTLFGQRLNTNYWVARTFYKLTSPILGIKIEIEGREHLENNGGPAVLVGNHQSFMDILYLGAMFPKKASIMAKKELSYVPFLGWWMSLSGTVWIDRKKSKNAIQAMSRAAEEIKKKQISVFIFPEGTRSSTPNASLLPFKKGAFHLAVQAQVPVIPIVCQNYHHIFDGKTRMNGGVLRLQILPPISTTGFTADSVGDLSDKTRETMLTALVELSPPASLDESSITSASTANRESTEQRPLLYSQVASVDSDTNDSNLETTYGAISGEARESGAITEEDEVDEDGAVVVPRPKAEDSR
ncbi:1-acylglycerol-3-phosphate o-acyltransferase [Phaffia rhodozyma]|uniref:1-acyl-sn-glycerol-3-phosphate acyltransferase n=1 Tax=Phaffia rhodozyma TaxID=264483 RepID=A0A0F7SU26_PHARH|nr:1-acylglycerol-3-phosphate o-acyltransferase [Phaffia rhodozyma]